MKLPVLKLISILRLNITVIYGNYRWNGRSDTLNNSMGLILVHRRKYHPCMDGWVGGCGHVWKLIATGLWATIKSLPVDDSPKAIRPRARWTSQYRNGIEKKLTLTHTHEATTNTTFSTKLGIVFHRSWINYSQPFCLASFLQSDKKKKSIFEREKKTLLRSKGKRPINQWELERFPFDFLSLTLWPSHQKHRMLLMVCLPTEVIIWQWGHLDGDR